MPRAVTARLSLQLFGVIGRQGAAMNAIFLMLKPPEEGRVPAATAG